MAEACIARNPTGRIAILPFTEGITVEFFVPLGYEQRVREAATMLLEAGLLALA